MSSSDLLHRFIFEQADIRGELVTLTDSYQEILGFHEGLPERVRALLGEFVAAATLLASSLKFEGILTLQARGDGPLPLIMAEANHLKGVRAIAQPDPDADFDALADADLKTLLGTGVLAMIIDPEQGERYQGLVPLEAATLSACLQHYFDQSEQLPTRFWLATNATTAAGMLLQALPQQVTSAEDNREHWNTVEHLAGTVKAEELLTLEHGELLYRLFHEQQVRLFEPQSVQFQCSCSRERSANALTSLGRDDVEALLAERDVISIDCKFCNRVYVFGPQDLDEIFGASGPLLH